MLIDVHAHLQDEKLKDRTQEIIIDAIKNDVEKIVCTGYDLESSNAAVELTKKYTNVYAVVGIHPEYAKVCTDAILEKIKELAKNSKVIGIGEIGLDYHFTKDEKTEQKNIFLKQIKIANELNLPIVIHTQDAMGDTLEIVRNNTVNKKGVFHCFNGSIEVLNEINEKGFYVSFGGAITFSNATNLQEIVKVCPLDKLLTETDCPYMTPVPYRGEINEPKNIKFILNKIGELKNIDIKIIENNIENNVKLLFNI